MKSAYVREQEVKAASADAKLFCDTLLSIADMLGTAIAGPEAALSPFERASLGPPIQRTYSRLAPAQIEFLQKASDPVTILLALGMWASRIVELRRAQQTAPPGPVAESSASPSQPPAHPPETVEHGNGGEPRGIDTAYPAHMPQPHEDV